MTKHIDKITVATKIAKACHSQKYVTGNGLYFDDRGNVVGVSDPGMRLADPPEHFYFFTASPTEAASLADRAEAFLEGMEEADAYRWTMEQAEADYQAGRL